MHPQDAIRRIRRQADRLRTLDAIDARVPAFVRWFRETSASLVEIFGSGTGPSREFQLAIFTPSSPSKYDPDSDYRRAYEKGVPIALSFFDSVVRDLMERPMEPTPQAESGASDEPESEPSGQDASRPKRAFEVLVLSGGDARTGADVAGFLEGVGASAAVVGEPGSGPSPVDSLTRSAAAFAVVLLEPGQRAGGAARKRAGAHPGSMRPSPARMFELGFVLGRLGGKKVCALLPEGVELGIDLDRSATVVTLDAGGAWKAALTAAMKSAGLPVAVESGSKR